MIINLVIFLLVISLISSFFKLYLSNLSIKTLEENNEILQEIISKQDENIVLYEEAISLKDKTISHLENMGKLHEEESKLLQERLYITSGEFDKDLHEKYTDEEIKTMLEDWNNEFNKNN